MVDKIAMANTAALHFQRFMEAIGCDIADEHLADTPWRVARMFVEAFNPDDVTITTFPTESDDMVVVKDIPFASFCAHHFLPFIGTVAVAYIPKGKIVGLSKIPRLIQMVSSAPQVQESMTTEINAHIRLATDSPDVAVVVRGQHLCMKVRGVKSDGEMVTSSLSGAFQTNSYTRTEFLSLVNGGRS